MYPFREGSFAVHNAWYIAAFAEDVTRTLMSRTILNQPIVLYRKENGEAVAIGGRCPHRHFPLGKGCLTGDTVVCGYHGIAFGPDGKCTDIPSQRFVPPTYRIPTYPLVEHGMWLWIWPGDPEKADVALLPDLEEIGYTEADMLAKPFYTHEVRCRYQLLNDNLLDLSHLAFLHGTSIGTRENASTPEELSKRPGFLSSRRYIRNAPLPALTSTRADTEGGEGREGGTGPGVLMDRVIGMDFYLPGFHAGLTIQSYPEGHESAGQRLHYSRVYHAVTPATPDTCYYFFGMSSPKGEGLDRAKDLLVPVIAEDIFASEEIEKMLKLVGYPSELMNKSDQNAVEGRRMLQKMMDEEGARRE